jgi:hypothetical protein
VNSVTFGADTPNVQHPSDAYFVHLDPAAPPIQGAPGRRATARAPFEPAEAPHRRRRRRRVTGRSVVLLVLVLSLGGWFFWASRRPGGVSGTINGWIDHVRGDVATLSADPDLKKATDYYNAQYSTSGAYPQLTDDQLALAGGVGISSQWCSAQAVVLQGAGGGGTVSRLLLDGHDVGTIDGKQGCPNDLDNPVPWKKR